MTAARLSRPATTRSLDLGGTTVSYVPDGAVQLSPRGWLPESTEEDWAAHPEYLDAEGYLVASIGGLLVTRGDRALLVDAGFGPRTMRLGDPIGVIHGGALLDNLAALGRDPAHIEAVAFTHLHTDHLGWAWHPAPGGDAPAFTGAEYLLAEPEWAHRAGTDQEILDALEPKVRTVADGEEIFPGVRVLVTEGHTAGHTAYVITGEDRRLIAFGDALHSPIQVGHPEWWAAPDHDRTRSTAARHHLVAELSRSDTVGFGIHFADVVFGHVHEEDGLPTWQPVDA